MPIDDVKHLFISIIESGETMYVSPTGSDDWDGSLDFPWRTINKANQMLLPGQTVAVRAGIYQETIAPINSGNPGNFITYKNYPNETVGIENVTNGANLDNKEHILIDGFNINNVSSRWCRLLNANNNIIQNCNMNGCNGWSGIILYKSKYNRILSNTIEGADDSLYILEQSMYNLVEGNEFGDARHGCIDIVGPTGSVEFGNGPCYNIIRDNYLHNKLHTSFQLEMNSYRNLIENNIIVNSDTTVHGNGPGLQLDASANIVRNNIIINNYNEGMAVNAYYYSGTFKPCNYNKIYNNVIYGNDKGHLTNTTEIIHDNIFKNNIYFHNNAEAIYFWSNDAANKNNIFTHNIIMNNVPGENAVIWIGQPRTLAWMQSNHPDLFFDNLEQDPLFTNPGNGDFTLQPGSPAIDAGIWLTHTIGSGMGNQIHVEDAGYFHDGFGLINGDMIKIGSNPVTMILNINYDSNIITINNSITWGDTEPVSLPYQGSAPNIGKL